MEALLPKDATFIDVNGVSMFLPTLNLYETITVDDMYPFGNCLVQSIREDKSIMLKDLTSGLECVDSVKRDCSFLHGKQ